MVKLTALAVAFALLASAAAGVEYSNEDLESDGSLWNLYELWLAHYKVVRDAGEKFRRFAIFKAKARRVYASHLEAAGETPLRLNIFADLSDEEVFRDYKCRKKTTVNDGGKKKIATVKRHDGEKTEGLPLSKDWRNEKRNGKPCLSPVKDQIQGCGSCWAFAATAVLESHNAIANNSPVLLSEQELVDCDSKSSGCDRGLAVNAFDYVMKKGLASSVDYPYTGKQGVCKVNGDRIVALSMRGFERVPANDEYQLLKAVTVGPVVVSIAIGNTTSFYDYTFRLYSGECGTDIDHEMLLVGYGYNYYILKNSYGEGWGDKGYMLLRRKLDDLKGTCGILMDGAAYPVVANWKPTDD